MANIAATLSLNVPAITALCKGAPGNSLLNGRGAPGAIGHTGDFYLDTSTYTIYGPLCAGSWGIGTLLNSNIHAPSWTSSTSTVSSLSANWQNAYTTSSTFSSTVVYLLNLSAYFHFEEWDAAHSTVNTLSSNWQSAYAATSPLQAASANWNNAYTTVRANSAGWNTGGGGAGDPLVNSMVHASSGYWWSVYTTVNQTSADTVATLNYVDTNGSSWDAAAATTYTLSSTLLQPNSGKWESVYATTRTYSGNWNSAYNIIPMVNSIYTTGNTYSANWNIVTSIVNSRHLDWDNSTFAFMNASASYDSARDYVNLHKDDWDYTAYTFLPTVAPVISSIYTTMTATSSIWGQAYQTPSVFTTVQNNSATWNQIVATPNVVTSNYQLALSDRNNTVVTNIGTANTVTIPAACQVAGFSVDIIQAGTGQTTIQAGAGVSPFNAPNGTKLFAQYSAATLTYISASIGWILYGDVTT